jgi:hypothetical protein
MGTVYADITLKNAGDAIRVECGNMPADKIRKTTVRAMVDTGTKSLVINEDIRQKLGLEIEGQGNAILANNVKEMCKLAGLVRITWKDRDSLCRAVVAPDGYDITIGIIPLGEMDLIVDPVKQELVGAHGDEVIFNVVSVR